MGVEAETALVGLGREGVAPGQGSWPLSKAFSSIISA